jgi:hypothetical protein
MNASQSDDACSNPRSSEQPSMAELNRVASQLRLHEWERFAYTDAANTARPVRKATVGLLTRLKMLLTWLVS